MSLRWASCRKYCAPAYMYEFVIFKNRAIYSFFSLTHISLACHKGTEANSVVPDQTPQNAASDQGLHCLH